MPRGGWAPGRADKRQTGQRALLPKLFLYTEGEVTEPDWLSWLQAQARDHVKLELVKAGAVPLTLADNAVQKARALQRGPKGSRSAHDEVWVVFDLDDHPQVPEAMHRCREEGVGVVFSNPCFELWGLLHHQDQSARMTRKACQERLGREHTGYHHGRNPRLDWDTMSGRREHATRRAMALHCALPDATRSCMHESFTSAWLLHNRALEGDGFQGWLAARLTPDQRDQVDPFLPRRHRA